MANEPATIDQDLYEGLQQARMKKPRNFALIAKGVEVVALIVQKKPINDGAVQKAKADCKGNLVIWGVCNGEGVELKFEVVGEEPGIAPKKVKEFISDHTDLALKPYWAVVPQLTPVVDDEAAPAVVAAASTPVPQATDVKVPDAAAAAVDPAIAFNERLKDVLPHIKAAAGTPAGEDAKLKASEAGVFARKKDLGQANLLLDQALLALKAAATGAAASQAASSATPPTTPGRTGSLVEKRKFLVNRWQRIPQEVRADLKALQAAIEREMPEEDADLLIELSDDYLDEFYGEMKEAIDDDINSGEAHYKSAISTISAFRSQIANDPLIQHLKTNKLNVTVTVESILLSALAEVEQSLAG